MISLLLQCVVCLLALCLHASAFWWAPPPPQPSTTTTTTTTESPLTLKQIPLTYFRTYTYQPLLSNPLSNAFGYPPFYGSAAAMQPQLLHSAARFDHFMHNYPFQRPSAGLYPSRGEEPVLQPKPFHGAMAPASPAGTTTAAATHPPTTSTTTTTTTTTPPPPPTTTTTTSTSTTTSTTSAPAPPPSPSLLPPQSASLVGAPTPVVTQRMTPFGSTSYPYPYPYPYPTYNRRAYVGGYNPQLYRQQYPYPEYTLYKTPAQNSAPSIGASQQMQFVPCMCPVSVGGVTPSIGAAALNANMIGYAPQGRTTGDAVDGELSDSDMVLPAENEEAQMEAETELVTDTKQKSKIVIEAEPVNLQRSAAKTFMLLGEPLMTNKLEEDGKLQTQVQVQVGESEAEV